MFVPIGGTTKPRLQPSDLTTMLHSLLLACSAVAFAATAGAQCATLAVTGGAPGTVLTITIDGTGANKFAAVVVGDTTGSSSIPLGPLGTINLGLAEPFVPLPIGFTDANGDAVLSFPVPADFPAFDLFAQGITLGLPSIGPGGGGPGGGGPPSLGLIICTTDVVAFSIGA